VTALGRILATGAKSAYVTMVIRIIPLKPRLLFLLPAALLLSLAPLSWTQIQATPAPAAPRIQDHSAAELYSELRTVGLDKSRVYNIRDVTLDRAAFHITFVDGTIAFTEDVAGHVTGAFF
jgi:hypothetical protein